MRVLITGNSGYIGSHLTHQLKGKCVVVGLDRTQYIIAPDSFLTQNIDYTFNDNTSRIFDAVIHLAAEVNVAAGERDPAAYYTTNIHGTLNVLRGIQTRNFIFASTGAAENPTGVYGRSKRAAEDIVQDFCNKKAINYTIFRFYNVIGGDIVPPTNHDGLMYNLLNATKTGTFTIHGQDYPSKDGTCERDYVHVNEICEAISTAVAKPSNRVESLGHGVGYTVKEIVDIFQRVNNVKFDIKFGPRRPGDLASSVLRNVSPFMNPTFSIDDLLKVNT